MSYERKARGFMPRRIEVTRIPSSYSIRAYGRPPRLNLEQIWAEQERKQKETPDTTAGSTSEDSPKE